jgi:hypothetical protein
VLLRSVNWPWPSTDWGLISYAVGCSPVPGNSVAIWVARPALEDDGRAAKSHWSELAALPGMQ